MALEQTKLGRGRPKKYNRESRVVTLTLPGDVLDRLCGLDTDIGQAIVKLVERQRPQTTPAGWAELSTFGRYAVILVRPGRVLRRLPGVQLVPVGDGRALISLDRPLSIPDLELGIRDAIDGTDLSESENQFLKEIADVLRQARVSRTMMVKERTIIVLESKRRSGRDHEARVRMKNRVRT